MINKGLIIKNILVGVTVICAYSCSDEANNSNVQVSGSDNAGQNNQALFELVSGVRSTLISQILLLKVMS